MHKQREGSSAIAFVVQKISREVFESKRVINVYEADRGVLNWNRIVLHGKELGLPGGKKILPF